MERAIFIFLVWVKIHEIFSDFSGFKENLIEFRGTPNVS